MPPPVTIIEANLAHPDHQREIIKLTSAYAADRMGNAGPLPPEVLARLIPGLQAHPTTIIFLAYAGDTAENIAVGIATCFLGFSTFVARPLINIHDLAVLPDHRGQGIGRDLLAAVDRKARELGCARVTLEVQERNTRAQHVYKSAGFAHAAPGQNTGGSLFYTKTL
jgi:GNAT superfamily N-acetyltransferase